MNLEQLCAWLFGRTSGGVRWGLDRTQTLLAEVGDPHLAFPALHIGGTNGKGSVAALCAAALQQGGARRVGLYTSPHLVSFTERVQVDGNPIESERFVAAAERLRSAIERTGATFFEATTAIALLCLAEADVDVAAVEVGLGGRLDATNVVSPLVTGVTNIALDHTELLGGTIAEIAAEKAGIFKSGIAAITGETDPGAVAVMQQAADAVGAPLLLLDEVATLRGAHPIAGGTRVDWDSAHWGSCGCAVPLSGAFQARNVMLAAETLALLPPSLRPSWEEVRDGFAATRWPGRMQIHRERGTTFLFDVAHNPAGVAALGTGLDELTLPRPWVLVAGILSDKHWSAMLPPLLERVDAAVLTIPSTAPAARRWDPEAAARALPPTIPIRVIPDLPRAVDRAVTLAPHGTVLVTGSIHTVGDTMHHLGISPFGTAATRSM